MTDIYADARIVAQRHREEGAAEERAKIVARLRKRDGVELKTRRRTLNALVADIYFHNQKEGWWDDGAGKYVIATKIALIHSEVSEMLEGFRTGKPDKHLPHRSNAEVELADAIIRLLDLAGSQGFDVEDVIAEKREYNAQRIDHSRAHRSAGGKAY